MNKKITIIDNVNNIRLRLAEDKDIELLRTWKNNNKASFFYQQEISPDQQKEWFSAYQKREYDYIFMVEEFVDSKYDPIGCMGFRVQDEDIDLYNIIRGKRSGTGVSMHRAMYIMLNYISTKYDLPIKCDVLKDNPAVDWYKKCGFDILREIEYYVMQIEKNRIEEIRLIIHEEESL